MKTSKTSRRHAVGIGAGRALVLTTLAFSIQAWAQALPHANFAQAAQQRSQPLRSGVLPSAALDAKAPGTVAPDMSPSGAPSNILFSQNFDSLCPSPDPPYVAPPGFTVYNLDLRTPAAAVSYVTDAWIIREDFQTNVQDCVMFSTSWYTPAGASNDWATFPTAAAGKITPAANTQLRWNAKNYDPLYLDGYEVRYSTATTAPADFLVNPTLFSTGGENAAWTARTVSLASLAGTPIHLAFRNNSTDKFLLVIDDVIVENIVAFDPKLNTLTETPGEYARIPLWFNAPISLAANVGNGGTSALTGVTVDADLLAAGVPVSSVTSPPITLAAGANSNVTLAAETYDVLGAWTADAVVTATEGDEVPANSALSIPLATITVDELGRAEGVASGTLGIGAGNGGELGQDFVIAAPAVLKQMRYTLRNVDAFPDNPDPTPDGDGVGDFNGLTLEANLRSFVAGEPGDILYTGSVTFPSDAAVNADVALQFDVPNLLLAPGRYVITAVEPTTPPVTLAVVQKDKRFTLGTTWVDWPTSPIPGWANNEDFGATFSKSYEISAILAEPVLVPIAVDDAFDVDEDGVLTDSVATNDTPSTDGVSTWAIDDMPASGTLMLDPDGSFVYTPDADFNGTDSFTYTLCDADADCDTATVAITVDAANDLPVAGDDAFTVPPAGIFPGDVSTNDTSVDGGNVWNVLTLPASGTLVFDADGTFDFTPAAPGVVTFTYELCDADDDCDSATVELTVQPFAIFSDSFESP